MTRLPSLVPWLLGCCLSLVAASGLAQPVPAAGAAPASSEAQSAAGGPKSELPQTAPEPAAKPANTEPAGADAPASAEARAQAEPATPATPAPTLLVPPLAAPRAAVRLIENGGRNVRLFMREGERWLPVCTSPCSFQAPGGPRDYAAPTGQGPVLALKTAAAGLWLTNGDGLQADFKDRKVVRKVGLCVLLGGLALLPFIAVAKDAKDREAALTGLLVPSGALSLSGVIMLLIKDRVGLTRCAGCNAQVPGAAR